MRKIYEVIVKATGEMLNVYRLDSGGYYDFDGMGASEPLSAPRSGKKHFKENELEFIKEK